MYTTLDQEFKVNEISKMEDDLKTKMIKVIAFKTEVGVKNQIVKQKTKRLEQLNKTEENQPQINELATVIAKTNLTYKRMRNQAVEDEREVKKQHEESLRLDANCKKKAAIIKAEKQKQLKCEKEGEDYIQKYQMTIKLKQSNQAIVEEVKSIGESRAKYEKEYKAHTANIEKRMEEVRHENSHLGVRNKEKEQEIKLSDLKIKEMRKTVPNTRLLPLKGRRSTVEAQWIASTRKSVEPGQLDPLEEKHREQIERAEGLQASAMLRINLEKQGNNDHYNHYIRIRSKPGAAGIKASHGILKSSRVSADQSPINPREFQSPQFMTPTAGRHFDRRFSN